MRIVVAGDYPREPDQISGGVEAHVLYLTQALQYYPDLDVHVVTLDNLGTGSRITRHHQVTVHYLAQTRLPSRLSAWGNIRRIRAKMIELEPDLIHAHVAGGYAEAAARTGLPWVLTLHGIRFKEVELWQGVLNKHYRGWFIKREEIQAVKKAKHIISINPFVQLTFDGQIQGQVYNIQNPVLEAFFDLPQQSGVSGQILFAGRLIPRKGVHTLLRAFARLQQRRPTVTLRLAGGSEFSHEIQNYDRELKRYVAETGLEKVVTFLGEVDQTTLLNEYANCSLVVLASVLETAPMVITQAMAAGKAVVSTDAGGARYMVSHGQSGLIVPPNDEQAMAEALYDILSNEAKWRAMGRQGRELAEKCSHPRVVAAQTRNVYYKILGRIPPPA
jgi:glycosyltransferase involved in cell wall biosynthesis